MESLSFYRQTSNRNVLKHLGLLLMVLASGFTVRAQVLTPMELPDPTSQRLQQEHMQALIDIGAQVELHKFPYPFYFSRVLDLDLKQQVQADQRSIRFENYKGQTVLELTGNYYAAYSADKMDSSARVKDTFNNVILPILQTAVPHFPDDSEFLAFAVEVSHHVRQRVMGISSENPENVTMIIPVAAAQKLLDAKNDDQRQAAILDGQIFLNAQPFSLWLLEGPPTDEWKERIAPRATANKALIATATTATQSNATTPTVSPNLLKPTSAPMRILTPESLARLEAQHEMTINGIVNGLDKEAHFLSYAPPTFIGFRQGAYLQLALKTSVSTGPGSSL